MNLAGRIHSHTVSTDESLSKYLPPPPVEYCYYFWVFYSIMGSALGISIDLLGIGMLGVLAAFCILRMGRQAPTLLGPIVLPLACAASFVGVQALMLEEPVMGTGIREMVGWMLGLVIVQSLALRRGFLHRFAIAMALIGLSMLPYLTAFSGDQSRTGLARGITIANPNDLGAWFGFCCVYFVILGLETRRNWVRAVSWGLAAGSLFVVGLTVSRAPLFAVSLCVLFAFRRGLKHGLIPLLSIVVVVWIAYALRVFDGQAAQFAERGLEETGRFVVWPLAIERFLQSPLAGVGVSHVATYAGSRDLTPHNGFIYIALASGVLPLALFTAYWVRLFCDALRINRDSHEDATFQTSLLLYAFLITMNLSSAFMEPWVMASLCTVAGTGFLMNVRRIVVARLRFGHAARRPHLETLAR
jgi:O-antigen ligase